MSEYGVIILGGTGQVGSAVVKAFLDSRRCREMLLLTRRPVADSWGERVRVVSVEPESADFMQEVRALVESCAPHVMFGVSCVGVGSGSRRWSEEDLIKLEVGVVGAFARGCKAGGVTSFGLLGAAGASSNSKIRYARVMGLKEKAVEEIGVSRLAIFRPGNYRRQSAYAGLGSGLRTLHSGSVGNHRSGSDRSRFCWRVGAERRIGYQDSAQWGYAPVLSF